MEEETILGKINNKIKGIKEKDSPKKKSIYKKTSEMNFSEYKIPKTNLEKISKIFKIEKKQKEKKEETEILENFENWLKKIKAKKISFENTEKKLYNNFFDIDLEIFKKEFLIKKENEKIEEIENEKMIDDFTDALEEKNLQVNFLNKEYFLEFEYKKNIKKNEILKTNEFIFSFTKIKNLFKILENNNFLKNENDNNLENNFNFDIFDILKNRLDLLILDNGNNNYEEFINTTMKYIFEYVSYFSKLKARNKKNIKKNKEKEIQKENDKEKISNEKIKKKISNEKIKEKISSIKKINGFTRPRVLVILNYKHEFFTLAQKLFSLSKNKLSKSEYTELENLYYSEENAFDDNFCVGISFKEKFIYKTSSFGKSDIIFGSLKFFDKNENDFKSFLSSIEISFFHKFEINLVNDLEMVKRVMKNINEIPEHKNCTENLEFVRDIFTNNISKFFRQNIFYSEFTNCELNSIINKNCFNYRGILKMKNYYINQISQKEKKTIKFHFEKISIKNLKTETLEKFNYFQNCLWKNIRKDKKYNKSLIIVNNYLIYKKLKNYLREKYSPVGFISEHTPKNKIQGVFAKFNTGAYEYILITERMLYFDICQPKRFFNVIFYNLPFFEKTWKFLLGNLCFDEVKENCVLVVFSKKDCFELERVIGTDKCLEFVNEKNRFKKFEL